MQDLKTWRQWKCPLSFVVLGFILICIYVGVLSYYYHLMWVGNVDEELSLLLPVGRDRSNFGLVCRLFTAATLPYLDIVCRQVGSLFNKELLYFLNRSCSSHTRKRSLSKWRFSLSILHTNTHSNPFTSFWDYPTLKYYSTFLHITQCCFQISGDNSNSSSSSISFMGRSSCNVTSEYFWSNAFAPNEEETSALYESNHVRAHLCDHNMSLHNHKLHHEERAAQSSIEHSFLSYSQSYASSQSVIPSLLRPFATLLLTTAKSVAILQRIASDQVCA